MERLMIAALMVIAGICAGVWKSNQLTKRHELLGGIIDGLNYMENEIYYTRERLDRVVVRVAEMSDGEASEFFKVFA
ncbi:MAG: hypothetical protein IKV96_05120, partial [Firmicutes bacterium]|nr:hypothetical protein [Bacillota bacterium]